MCGSHVLVRVVAARVVAGGPAGDTSEGER